MDRLVIKQQVFRTSIHLFASLTFFYPLTMMCSKLTLELHVHACRSISGVVVKLLACGARGPGFDSKSFAAMMFRDWLSGCFQVRDMAEMSLKRRKSSKQQTTGICHAIHSYNVQHECRTYTIYQ